MKKILFIVIFLYPALSFSTHLRGGQITVTRINGLNCKITLRVFTNVASPILFSNAATGELSFGDGSPIHNPPQMVNSQLAGETYEFGYVEYSIYHTYPGPGNYVISYFEHNLNAGILNITNSVETAFFMESGINIDASNDYSSPRFPTDPIFHFPLQRTYTFSTAPVDSINHRYQYQLITPSPTLVTNYQIPGNFSVNRNSGLVTWDTKFMGNYSAGEFIFWIRIIQYDENGLSTGFVQRAFQVIMEENQSRISIVNPINHPEGKVVVTENNQQSIKLILEDTTTSDSVHWKVYFDSKIQANIHFAHYDSSSTSRKMKIGLLTIQTDPTMVRDYPYVISLRGASFFKAERISKDVSFMLFTKDIDLPVITGLTDSPKTAITVYPNPFSDSFFIDGLDSSPVGIVLLNNLGQKIFQTQVQSREPVDASQLSSGVYILQINGGPRVVRQKIVKR